MELIKEIKKSFPKIEKLFSEEKLSEFLETSPHDLEKYNFGLGTMIRLKILRPKSPLYKEFIKHGFFDKDEMALEIIKNFHEDLRQNTQNND